MSAVVISQPFYFPWVGLFEQIRLCDVFVHYDDVAFSKGGFSNRVQIKTNQGSQWLTVPLRDVKLGAEIRELGFNETKDWRKQHINSFHQAYARAPFKTDAAEILEKVLASRHSNLADLSIASVEAACEYLGLDKGRQFFRSSELGIGGNSSERVLDLVRHFQGTVYVTGHGARNYLDHEGFEGQGVSVQYMDYRRMPYAQLHGAFDPHVSILDLIANHGRSGIAMIISGTKDWKEFIHGSH
jgi:WbqC-like protein family